MMHAELELLLRVTHLFFFFLDSILRETSTDAEEIKYVLFFYVFFMF